MATDKSPGAQISTALPPDVAAALTALQSGGIFIGVPKGSQTEARLTNLGVSARTAQRFGARAGSFGPIGFEGYKTGSELDQLAGFGPDEIAALQQRFYDAGLIDSYLPGQLDKTTRNAFKELLAESNAAGRKWTQTLDMISALPKAQKQTAKNPPLTITLSDPDTLRHVAREVTSKVAGGGIPKEEIDRFIETYHQLETQRQTESYYQTYGAPGGPASQQGPGGTSLDPHPDVGATLEAQLRREHPADVTATYLGSLRDNILAVLTRGATQGQTAGGA